MTPQKGKAMLDYGQAAEGVFLGIVQDGAVSTLGCAMLCTLIELDMWHSRDEEDLTGGCRACSFSWKRNIAVVWQRKDAP